MIRLHARNQLFLFLAAAFLLGGASRPPDVPFRLHTLDLGASETAAVADINRDGRLDIVSGENWYEAPNWTQHRFRELDYLNNYIDAFSDLPIDVNGDGYPDVVTASWFAKKLSWWKNPGKAGGAWTESVIDSGFNIEFAFLVDLDNDGQRREILPEFGNANAPLAWYELKNGAWVKHVVSPKSYGHGIGAGDVNGDGRADILTPKGWLEAPADPRSEDWKFHPDWDEKNELGFLYAIDLNGDGLNDVLTTSAHGYGILWYEHGADGHWTRRVIDESWSQAHAATLVDLNGDGRLDLVTGKRYMAHNGSDPGEREPLGVYWYEYRKGAQSRVEWVRHVIDYSGRTGGGMQIPAVDIDGDGDIDLVCAGKSGLFLLENLTHKPR
ncbi:MAG TPA: VCBS repeat-containing protein [Bryobacteraceae bacterium]